MSVGLIRNLLICLAFLVLSLYPESTLAAKNETKDEEKQEGKGLGELSSDDGSDYVCESEIHYTWQSTPVSSAGKRPKGADEADKRGKKITVYHSTIGSHGLVLEEVEQRLIGKLSQAKHKALDSCKRKHQDQASCIASGLRGQSYEYNRHDFAAKSALLSALREDCRQSFGTCLSAEASKPRCFINRPSDLPKKAEKEEGTKEEKKKKGK